MVKHLPLRYETSFLGREHICAFVAKLQSSARLNVLSLFSICE